MERLKKFKPAFWDHGVLVNSHSHTTFNFRRKWKLIVFFTTLMALSPLFVMSLVDFSLTRRIIEDEVKNGILHTLNSTVALITNSPDPKATAMNYITHFNSGKDEDIFVINEDGSLLTPSYYYGKPGFPNTVNTNHFNGTSGITEDLGPKGIPIIAGYARIPNSEFMLIQVKSKKWMTDLWFKPRLKLIGYLVISIVLILISILGMATYLVGRIHSADKKRIDALHHVENTNKLASIGRLASGVAHEVNNPLEIINQKTGLIMDLFTLKEEFSSDERLMPLAKDILDAVNRCGSITKRLLNFARHMESSIQPVNINKVIDQVLAFLEKEAERRNITISMDTENTIQGFECDRGSLQQIFLNLFNNAFAAMEDGGQLKISTKLDKTKKVKIMISDNGKGIPHDEIHKIFEPFYSSGTHHGGAGLGLSITYGLVKEIGGNILVKSKPGKGTRFTLVLPLKAEKNQDTSTFNSETI